MSDIYEENYYGVLELTHTIPELEDFWANESISNITKEGKLLLQKYITKNVVDKTFNTLKKNLEIKKSSITNPDDAGVFVLLGKFLIDNKIDFKGHEDFILDCVRFLLLKENIEMWSDEEGRKHSLKMFERQLKNRYFK